MDFHTKKNLLIFKQKISPRSCNFCIGIFAFFEENGFELTKKRSRRYPAKSITDADYADDIAILANTPNQVETLLHSLEHAAGIGLHVNEGMDSYR